MRLLTELSAEHGFTLCVSLHDIGLAKEFFPRLVGMRRGAIVFDGAPGELSAAEEASLYDLVAEEMMRDA